MTSYIIRPNIQCVFDMMNECNSFMGDEDKKKACVEGARDAHLQPTVPRVYNDERCDEAYTIGWNSTVVSCPYDATWS